MRIISGLLRGRKLKNFKAPHIRPTTDRVKESVFNKLSPYLGEARVLDLFSGTGNLSFEAYSRGATDIVSVENSLKSIKIIKENIAHLDITKQIQIVNQDVISFIKFYKGKPFDVILIDPPFKNKMAHDVMNSIPNSAIYHDDTIICIESSSQERIDESYKDLKLWDRKNFGDKVVSFFIKDIQ